MKRIATVIWHLLLMSTLVACGATSTPTPSMIINTRLTPTMEMPAPIQSGQIRGILVDEKGRPLSDEVEVCLCTMLDEVHGPISIDTSQPSVLGDAGEFFVDNVPPGRYCLALYYKQTMVIGVILKGGKLFTFEMPPESGIDFGRVDASQVYFPKY